MKKLMMMAAVLALAAAANARTFEVKAWRGETVSALVPDFVEFGEVPAGVDIRFGVLRPVKYAPEQNSIQRLECFDRVEWAPKPTWFQRLAGVCPEMVYRTGTPRVVEVTVPARMSMPQSFRAL